MKSIELKNLIKEAYFLGGDLFAISVYQAITKKTLTQCEIYVQNLGIDSIIKIYKKEGSLSAIKYYRKMKGAGLREAKEAVDEILGRLQY